MSELFSWLLSVLFTPKEIGIMENAPWAVVKIAIGMAVFVGLPLWLLISWRYRGIIEAKDAGIGAMTIAAENTEKLYEGRLQSLKEIIADREERLHLVPATNRYGQMSTAETATAARNLAAKLRREEESNRTQSWQSSNAQSEAMRKAATQEEKDAIWNNMWRVTTQLSDQRRAKWEQEYKSEALLLREEMLTRVPKETREKVQLRRQFYAMGWLDGVADDLEMLAGTLSE